MSKTRAQNLKARRWSPSEDDYTIGYELKNPLGDTVAPPKRPNNWFLFRIRSTPLYEMINMELLRQICWNSTKFISLKCVIYGLYRWILSRLHVRIPLHPRRMGHLRWIESRRPKSLNTKSLERVNYWLHLRTLTSETPNGIIWDGKAERQKTNTPLNILRIKSLLIPENRRPFYVQDLLYHKVFVISHGWVRGRPQR